MLRAKFLIIFSFLGFSSFVVFNHKFHQELNQSSSFTQTNSYFPSQKPMNQRVKSHFMQSNNTELNERFTINVKETDFATSELRETFEKGVKVYQLQKPPSYFSDAEAANTEGYYRTNKTNSTKRVWHTHVSFEKVGAIYIYDAYLDLREPGKITVRLLALQHSHNQDSIICNVSHGEKDYMAHAEIYRMCDNHGKAYEGWIYSCKMPNTISLLPTHISVSLMSQRFSLNRTIRNLKLKTIPPIKNNNSQHIGVCVPPLFGDINLSSLLHFIEMCKILGAKMVFLYVESLSSELSKFMEFQSEHETIVSVIDWNLPENLSTITDQIWYHGQVLAIQDCLYQNMAAFDFLLFMDLDEMLVPQIADDWQQMLKDIFSSVDQNTIAALSFKSAFFDLSSVSEDLGNSMYFQYLQRTRSVSKVHKKLIVQPMFVFELGIHHLSKALAQGYGTIDVSPKQALLHHYNKCANIRVYEPSMKCFTTVKDKRILKYQDKLTNLSQQVITHVSKLFT